jgi:hypothetical protein
MLLTFGFINLHVGLRIVMMVFNRNLSENHLPGFSKGGLDFYGGCLEKENIVDCIQSLFSDLVHKYYFLC